MTFKTTSLPLFRVLGNQLEEYKPLKPLASQTRWLLVTPAIRALLEGVAQVGVFPDVEAERVIGRYAGGHLLRYSLKKTENKPDIEKIEGYHEVWALCFRRPRPGWRILGRFYDKDVFIALRPWEKNKLFSNYATAAKEVIDDWDGLFQGFTPNTGRAITDYLSGVLQDADEQI